MTPAEQLLPRGEPFSAEDIPGLDMAVEQSASKGDHRWFEAHPERSHRIRERIAGELGELLPTCKHVVVVKIRPGKHARQLVQVAEGRPRPPDRDDALRRLLELTWAGQNAYWTERGVFSLKEIQLGERTQSLRYNLNSSI